jgi:hypothetical protein
MSFAKQQNEKLERFLFRERNFLFAQQGRLKSLTSFSLSSSHSQFMSYRYGGGGRAGGREGGRQCEGWCGNGDTQLHLSASEGHEHVVKWLLCNHHITHGNVNAINRVSRGGGGGGGGVVVVGRVIFFPILCSFIIFTPHTVPFLSPSLPLLCCAVVLFCRMGRYHCIVPVPVAISTLSLSSSNMDRICIPLMRMAISQSIELSFGIFLTLQNFF